MKKQTNSKKPIPHVNSKDPILHSLDVIESQISDKLTVEHIANSVHFSKFHYQRMFREMVGDSVMEYVTKRKLTLAGKELLETNAAVIDIAMKFGYDSREGFSRSFKAYMGITPGEYRKYSLASITQKPVKERGKMMLSKTTNEIIRELNDFIVTTKETATMARKEKSPEYEAFWDIIADTTDNLANRVQAVIERVTAIAERPDEITNRFAILNAITDNAFQSNLLAFNVGLMVSRAQPEHAATQSAMSGKFYALANAAYLKAGKIAEFFSELAALIFEDIEKSYAKKMQDVVQTAKSAIAPIEGYENIKFELQNFVARLEQIPFDENVALHLSDCLFQLNIISFAAITDAVRNPQDKEMFKGLAVLKDTLADAIEFTETLPKGVATVKEHSPQKHMQDFAFQGNILLFYVRSEIEKLNKANVLNDGQNKEMSAVCEKINVPIRIANSATDESAAEDISQYYAAIADDMNRIADELGLHGNPIKFLATEVKNLSDRAKAFV